MKLNMPILHVGPHSCGRVGAMWVASSVPVAGDPITEENFRKPNGGRHKAGDRIVCDYCKLDTFIMVTSQGNIHLNTTNL